MWIFLLEAAGVVLSLAGWFGFHSFWLLLAGVIMMVLFDCLMSSSGGQLKSAKVSVMLIIAGAIAGGLTRYGILTAALLVFAVYSAFAAVLKLILLFLGALDRR